MKQNNANTVDREVVAKNWFSRASEDLRWARSDFENDVYYGACFVSHQIVEKALKAYLISSGVDISSIKIHDVVALVERSKQFDENFEILLDDVASLSGYYLATRYPDSGDIAEFDDHSRAKDALRVAKKVLGFVEERILG